MKKTRKADAAARIAVVAGASGLVGCALGRRLLQTPAYRSVVALTRRPIGSSPSSPHLVEVPARFDALETVLTPRNRHSRRGRLLLPWHNHKSRRIRS